MAEHTKAPWYAMISTTGIPYVVDDFRNEIATVSNLCNGIDNASKEEEQRANAELIARAPALEAENAALKAALEKCIREIKIQTVMHTDFPGNSNTINLDNVAEKNPVVMSARALLEEKP